jgi:hypothetical protein
VSQVSPIQNTIYLASMAVIAGARTWHQVRATVRAGFMPVMKISWISSPIALAFAQKFLPEQTWVPFFNTISFVIGTYINTHTKKKRLAALRKKVGLFSSPLSYKVADNVCSTTEMGGAHRQAENISHLDRAIALKAFQSATYLSSNAPFDRMNPPRIVAMRLLADIHPFVELGDWLTLFEWAFTAKVLG